MENKYFINLNNLEEEIFSNKYYFLIDQNNGIKALDKKCEKEEFDKIKNEYLKGQIKNYSSLDLVNNVFFNVGNKRKKLIIIDIEDERILTLLEDVLEDIEYIVFNNKMFVYYEEELDIELKRIYEAVSFDFGIKFRMFVCDIISIKDSVILYYLWDDYFKNKINDIYLINDLILEINKRNYKLIKQLKKVLLDKILIDQQLISLIKSMIENDLNISKSASELFMHRNTVNYKIEYIRKNTGFNIQKFKDALSLYILLDL